MKKIVLLFVVAVMAVFMGCKKEEKNNYPESLVGSVWESNELALNSGSGTMRLEFYNINTCRVIYKTEQGEWRFDSSIYSYYSGKVSIYVREPWTMKLKTGEVLDAQTFETLKQQLLNAGNFTSYYQLVQMLNQAQSATRDTFEFSVEGSVMKADGVVVLNRK